MYCPHCGTQLRGLEDGESELSSITNAVRENEDTASKEKREKRYNQQQWGLFETNYQREKGITTEESLQEIERFERDGIAPTPAPSHSATVGGHFRQQLEGVLNKDDEEEDGAGNHSPTQRKESLLRRASQRLSKTFSGRGSVGGSSSQGGASSTGGLVQDEFNQRMAHSGHQGAAFFEKYQKREAQKYRPQHL
eukprot:CAMPEP_0171498682 /NCGR_PEP_ID=MMETSP0958-20121227/7991_1 /TAXON_ID=87120 /ORGANISM="Aurantiochytrium limacinum, Strain ATCCMYA-1381" /LENGTH=193 /DNA_ID=CAMNT_0012033119 /DNA_START=88 /DNA_END=669 /DNA_ORIENTATION=+